MEDEFDDRDDSKRKTRNLSEKKRRDQFNMLVNELNAMVSTSNRKMDKSTILKSTITFLKNHNEVAVRSRVNEIQEDWKPSFLSNEEFTHLILEALDGFIMVFTSSGKINYASESITSLLGHLPGDLLNTSIYEITNDRDRPSLFSMLQKPSGLNVSNCGIVEKGNKVAFACHLKTGCLDQQEGPSYELVQFTGYFRSPEDLQDADNIYGFDHSADSNVRSIFVCTGRLQTPQLIRDMSVVDSSKSEFTSRHSLEWKFLFLDHRAPPIIGYLPFEVLGTSGYDYYHFDDLDKVVNCHEALMQKGEGTSCYYRFLTKGQQWIWLQTRFYITYHQWNSKPEFVVCTHRVVSYQDVIKSLHREPEHSNQTNASNPEHCNQTNASNLEHCKQINASNSEHCNQTNGTNPEHCNQINASKPEHNINYENQNNTHFILQNDLLTFQSNTWKKRSAKTSRNLTTDSSGCKKNYNKRSNNIQNSNHGSDTTSMSADSLVSRQTSTTHQSSCSVIMHAGALSMHQQSRCLHNTHHSDLMPQHMLQTPHMPQLQQIPPQIQHQQGLPQVQQFPEQLIPQYEENQQFLAVPVPSVINLPPMKPLPVSPDIDIMVLHNQVETQGQLQKKHEELKQMIRLQQEELRRVSEQLVMARYGLLPPIINVTVPYNGMIQGGNNITWNDIPEMYQQQPVIQEQIPQQQMIDQMNPQQFINQSTTIPMQMSQNQAQLLFSSTDNQIIDRKV